MELWREETIDEARVRIAYDGRYRTHGDLVVGREYRGGGQWYFDGKRSIALGSQTARAIRVVWEAIFEDALICAELEPESIGIHVAVEEFPEAWRERIRTIAEVIACEVPNCVVCGTGALIQPS